MWSDIIPFGVGMIIGAICTAYGYAMGRRHEREDQDRARRFMRTE